MSSGPLNKQLCQTQIPFAKATALTSESESVQVSYVA